MCSYARRSLCQRWPVDELRHQRQARRIRSRTLEMDAQSRWMLSPAAGGPIRAQDVDPLGREHLPALGRSPRTQQNVQLLALSPSQRMAFDCVQTSRIAVSCLLERCPARPPTRRPTTTYADKQRLLWTPVTRCQWFNLRRRRPIDDLRQQRKALRVRLRTLEVDAQPQRVADRAKGVDPLGREHPQALGRSPRPQ